MSNDNETADEQPTDWGTNVGRDDVVRDDVQVQESDNKPNVTTTPAQLLRLAMVEQAAKVLTGMAARTGFASREAASLDDVLELADYYIGDVDDDYPMRGVVVDEGKEFFDRVSLKVADRAAAQAEQARIYRDGMGSLFQPRSTTKGIFTEPKPASEASFADLLDALIGKPVQANILVEELQVGDVVTSHGDKVVGQPTWSGTTQRWLVDVHCPKRDKTFTHRAKVDEKVDIYNER